MTRGRFNRLLLLHPCIFEEDDDKSSTDLFHGNLHGKLDPTGQLLPSLLMIQSFSNVNCHCFRRELGPMWLNPELSIRQNLTTWNGK